MKKIFAGTILTALFAALFTLAAAAEDKTEGAVLAIVGDKVITTYDLYGVMNAGANSGRNFSSAERAALLERLIDNELIYMDFKALKGRIPEKYIQERLDRIVFEQANGSEEGFRDMLHRDNVTWQEFRERVFQQLAVEMLSYDRTRRNLTVSDREVADYFAAHRDEFVTAPQWRLQVIMFRKDGRYAGKIADTVAQVRKELAAGKDFGELAKAYSEGMNAGNGGDLGWQSAMAAPLQELAEKLRVGEVYGGVLDMGNVYLVRLAGCRGGEKPELTPELSAQIARKLEDLEAQRRYREYVDKLYQKYPVRRFDR